MEDSPHAHADLDTRALKLDRIGPVEWEIPMGTVAQMKTPARIIASKALLEKIRTDRTLRQLANVACLPGIVKFPISMPDSHEGYGFPIGGVVALDCETGGISPGGIGYDINCGVRLIRTNLSAAEVRPKIKQLLDKIHDSVPSGVGRATKRKLSPSELDAVLVDGAKAAVRIGQGWKEDLEHCEEGGSLPGARPEKVSAEARDRGKSQVGTLGAGNHFLEVQEIGETFGPEAEAFGLEKGKAVVMIHCGSRGFGHQVCSDYLRVMEDKFKEEISGLPDRELAYAPAGTREADDYFSAMACAVNFAFTNRQAIMHSVRGAFSRVFGRTPEDLGMSLLYDVAHNIAKIEEHHARKCFVHRKGATRAFGPGRKEVPQAYRRVGQPVLLPGSMGTASYVLVGSETAMERTFGSTAHGAGRMMSRGEALRRHRGEEIVKELGARGILVRCDSWRSIAEEAPDCYKDIDEVARVSHEAGIGRLVARMRPIGVVKG